MAITFTNLGSSANPDFNNNANAASYLTPSAWTPPSAGVTLCAVYNTIAAVGNVPTMTGNNLTWVQIATAAVDPGISHRLTWFAADNSAGPTNGQTTIGFGGETQTGCQASFFQVEGLDLSGGVAGIDAQQPTNNGTGTSGTVDLETGGPASADNRPVVAFGHQADELSTPDGAWTEVDDLQGGAPVRNLETQWDADGFQNASATWTTSSAWIGLALELKAEAVAAADTGLMVSPGVLAGTDANVFNESGAEISPAVLSGIDANVFNENAAQISPAVLSGADSNIFNEAAGAQSPGVLSGEDANVFNETAGATSPGALSGADANIFGEIGATTSPVGLSAEDANVFNESGLMASPGVLAGTSAVGATYDKSGALISPISMTGADANVFDETIVTVVPGVLAGKDANIFSETIVTASPGVLAGASVYEPGAGVFTKTGVMASPASLSGEDANVFGESGITTSPSVLAGMDANIFGESGTWFAPSVAAGIAVVPGAGGASDSARWFVFGADEWDTRVRVTHGEPQRGLLEPLDMQRVMVEDEELMEILMML